MKVLPHDDASAFCDKALPYLLQREAENNLMIGIAATPTLWATAACLLLPFTAFA